MGIFWIVFNVFNKLLSLIEFKIPNAIFLSFVKDKNDLVYAI